MSLESRWQSQLDALRRDGRYRRLTLPAGLDFSSNDYLGYTGLDWPPACGARSGAASRLLRGHTALWDEVETRLAHWHGCEATLMFTSGYVANEGLLATVIEPGDFVASDECNHASIIDGLRLSKAERFVYRHNDLAHLEAGLEAAARHHPATRGLFIVTESLFGMEGDRAPLIALAELAHRYDAQLIVDEAHATGCFGAHGSGLVDELGLRHHVLASVHTGGKALGVVGAYVALSRILKAILVNRCRHLIFTTALPPVVAPWWLAMLERIASDPRRARLHENVSLFRKSRDSRPWTFQGSDHIVPVILGSDADALAAARHLQAQGFDVRAIRPPSVAPGTARLRIAIHADHASADLVRLASAVSELAPAALQRV